MKYPKYSMFLVLMGCSLLIDSFMNIDSAHADEIVAVVNKNVILKSELDAAYKLLPSGRGAPKLPIDKLLDELITQRIQLDLADRLGVYVSDAEVGARANQILRGQKLTKSQQLRRLRRAGLTYADWLEQISDSVRLRNLQFQQLSSYIKVNENEIDNALVTNTPAQLKAASYNLVHLVVSEKNMTPNKLQELYIELEPKNSIGAVEKHLLKLNVPDINVNVFRGRSLISLPDIFYSRLVIMEKGEVSYFKNDGFWHLIKVIDVKYPKADILVEYKMHSISLQSSIVYDQERVRVGINDLYKEVQSGAEFKDLANIYFDQSSPLQEFFGNWFAIEQLPRVIKRELVKLKPGSFSKPFPYDGGWHIIRLDEKRANDRTLQKWRNNIYQQLANRKLVITIPFWISDISSRAYVEKRI
ncbi:MAG: hypothetical protein HAW61_04805 [Candidatus Portiera sp.]|nr:hypothetical protein [Portiera sp.]